MKPLWGGARRRIMCESLLAFFGNCRSPSERLHEPSVTKSLQYKGACHTAPHSFAPSLLRLPQLRDV